MKTAIILHGTLGSPSGNWFTWLKSELEQRGLQVWLPQLPDPGQPSLSKWAAFVQTECPFPIDDKTLIIGHSSGAILALILAQQNPRPIGAIAAISVFHDNSLHWQPNDQLFDIAFAWEVIQANTQQFLFIHSDDDPYIPLDQAQYVARNCNSETVVIPGQGHFNLEKNQAYTQFPKLINLIEKQGWL